MSSPAGTEGSMAKNLKGTVSKANPTTSKTRTTSENWRCQRMRWLDGSSKLVNSQIDMESIDDKSRVCLFIKHDANVDLKEFVKKD